MANLDDFKARAAERRLDGVYKQRGDNDYVMLRVRVPGCRLSADQLMAIAELSGEFGDGVLHLTTRGDVELHGVRLSQLDDVIERLGDAGLTTRGACGDCVRNVIACPGAGICPYEVIDAATLAQALSKEFAECGEYEDLPRKFKIAISGCRRGCGLNHIQDVGIVPAEGQAPGADDARLDVFLAGGLGRHPRLGRRCLSAVSVPELAAFVRAALQCFNERGDRERRHRARLKFVAENMGDEALLKDIQRRMARPWHYQI